MVDNSFVLSLETKVYDRLKKETETILKTKYPKIFFTTVGNNKGVPTYPTVYIYQLPGAQIGNDLDGTTVPMVYENLQIDVITDTSKKDANEILTVIAQSMTGMRFRYMQTPTFDYSGNIYRETAVFRRAFGNGEEL